jgi:hypothetical protein
MEQIARARERDVGDDSERLAGKRDIERVALNDGDVRPPVAKSLSESRVELDRDDTPCDTRELRGEPSRAGADVDDEIGRTDLRTGDDRGGEGTAAKEVAATR